MDSGKDICIEQGSKLVQAVISSLPEQEVEFSEEKFQKVWDDLAIEVAVQSNMESKSAMTKPEIAMVVSMLVSNLHFKASPAIDADDPDSTKLEGDGSSESETLKFTVVKSAL